MIEETCVAQQAVARFQFSALAVGSALLSFSASSTDLGGAGDALVLELDVKRKW